MAISIHVYRIYFDSLYMIMTTSTILFVFFLKVAAIL